jgi:hypothetical protein
MTYQSKTPQGADKVSRYKWNMQDLPGTLAQVSKNDIHFDKSYQREVNHAKVKAIASNWSWLAMGVITLADRGGRFYAVDGMHRVTAALLRSDIDYLPCIIFKTKDIRQEASGFVQANTLRKAVSTFDKHKALVLAGDEMAIFVQSLLDKEGFHGTRTTSGPNTIKCFGQLYQIAKAKPDALIKAWPLVAEISRGRIIHERILHAVVFLVERASEDVTSGKWRKKLLEIGYDGLKRAAEEAAAYYSRGGSAVWADGVLKAMNKNMRYKLEISNAKS